MTPPRTANVRVITHYRGKVTVVTSREHIDVQSRAPLPPARTLPGVELRDPETGQIARLSGENLEQLLDSLGAQAELDFSRLENAMEAIREPVVAFEVEGDTVELSQFQEFIDLAMKSGATVEFHMRIARD